MNRTIKMMLLGAVIGVLTTAPAWGADFFVPGTHATIQGAVNAASSGDVIQVSAGTYYENVYMKPGVQLIGAGPSLTVLDGGSNATVVSIPYGSGNNTRIEGFTLQHGNGQTGGGLRISSGASPVVTNCWIDGNHASARGGGIYIDAQSAPTIEFCVIKNNSADEGGGIFVQTSDAVLRWNVICHNSALVLGGGVHIAFAMNITIENNSICLNEVDHDYGAGLSVASSMGTVQRNIIAVNTGSAGFYTSGSILDNDCNIVWGNPSGDYYGIAAGENSLSVDPLFCDMENCDLTVSGSSPAVTTPGCDLIGAETIGCGFTPTENTSWSGIKSMYR